MIYLLDTCAISELVARQPNPDVVHWIDSVDEDKLFLSAITIGEIKRGIEKLADSERKRRSRRVARGRSYSPASETESCRLTSL